MRGHADMVEKLLRCDVPGADGVDRFGSTLLSLAARHGHLATVELLLQQSAVTLDKKDVLGRSALDWARREGHGEIADKILVKSRVLGISMEDATAMVVAAGVEREIKPATQYCDVCTLFIRSGSRFHCSLCNGGDFDVCRDCIDAGAHCFDSEHRLEPTVP
jgi:ankyrin repeat protein